MKKLMENSFFSYNYNIYRWEKQINCVLLFQWDKTVVVYILRKIIKWSANSFSLCLKHFSKFKIMSVVKDHLKSFLIQMSN